jgi:hypothetical protein
MANQYASPGFFGPQYHDNLNRAIEALWMRRDEHAGVLGQFFDVSDAESLSFQMSSVSSVLGLPRKSEDTDAMPYDTSPTGFKKTISLQNYRLAVRVTDTMIRADRFDRIVQQAGGLMKSAERKLEYQRAGIFNSAFTGTSGADVKPLIGDDHPQEDPTAGTWDNEGTSGALTGATLQALRLLARKMTNEKGYPDPVMPVTLLVPPELEQKALELTGATLRAEDALNAPTVLISNLKVVVSPFLSSATAFYLIGDRTGMDKGLHEMYLMRPSMDDETTTVDIPINKRIKFINAVDFSTSRNIYGNLGT